MAIGMYLEFFNEVSHGTRCLPDTLKLRIATQIFDVMTNPCNDFGENVKYEVEDVINKFIKLSGSYLNKTIKEAKANGDSSTLKYCTRDREVIQGAIDFFNKKCDMYNSSKGEIGLIDIYEEIGFKNEIDKKLGIESICNEKFFEVFPFDKNKSILISDNRLFISKDLKSESLNISNIQGIPDGLLIEFTEDVSNPIKINIIEYECFGWRKNTPQKKEKYLFEVIIPQLIRFSNIFSIVTNENIRVNTIKSWTRKIIQHIQSQDDLELDMYNLLKNVYPEMLEVETWSYLEYYIKEAFSKNIEILLIIDDFSDEDYNKVKNIVGSFILPSNTPVTLSTYKVSLIKRETGVTKEISPLENGYALIYKKYD